MASLDKAKPSLSTAAAANKGGKLYRRSSAGLALIAALKQMKDDEDITDSQYHAIVQEFDASFQENLRKQCIENKLSTPVVQAVLDNYNIVNDDCRLDGTNATIKICSKEMAIASVHVECDS